MINAEAYCRRAAQEWQATKDTAVAQMAALLPRELRLAENAVDLERIQIEIRIQSADGMIRWYLSDEAQKFVRAHTRT